MKCRKAIFYFILLAMMRNSSDAGIIASFTSDGSAFMPSAINVGQFVDVPLYLVQTNPNTELTTGLLTAGIGVNFAPTGVVNASFLSYGPGWDIGLSASSIDNPGGFASLQTSVGFFDPGVTDGGTNSILLGTFRFTGVSAGSSMFTLTDADPGLDDTVLDDGMGTVLDSTILFGGTSSITVNGAAAVPEPSAGLALMIGTGIMVWRTRKRRQRDGP